MPPSEHASTHPGRETHRLSELLGLPVEGPDGRRLGEVGDVRLTRTAGRSGPVQLVAEGLVVGGGHPGSLLGYDRRGEQGPALVRAVVRWLHRDARYLAWPLVRRIDWERGVVVAATAALPPLLTAPGGGASSAVRPGPRPG
jgi:hypothetical protein